jgi:hypothetical protein
MIALFSQTARKTKQVPAQYDDLGNPCTGKES